MKWVPLVKRKTKYVFFSCCGFITEVLPWKMLFFSLHFCNRITSVELKQPETVDLFLRIKFIHLSEKVGPLLIQLLLSCFGSFRKITFFLFLSCFGADCSWRTACAVTCVWTRDPTRTTCPSCTSVMGWHLRLVGFYGLMCFSWTHSQNCGKS